jgi:hypothetical protein
MRKNLPLKLLALNCYCRMKLGECGEDTHKPLVINRLIVSKVSWSLKMIWKRLSKSLKLI